MRAARDDAWSGMEIGQALTRVLLGHWRLLVALGLAGLAGGFVLHVEDRTVYSATARVEMDVGDPSAASGSQGVSDTARAIVTSPSHVASAIAAVHVARDPATLAERAVSVSQMGASNVVQIAVQDQDPRVAARLANALAADLVRSRRAGQGSADPTADQQIAQVQAQLDLVNGQIGDLESRLSAAQPADVSALSARLTSLDSERGNLTAQLLAVQSRRQQELLPLVIDSATPPPHPAASRRPLDMALGAVLGLLIAIVVAGAVETLRPRVVGSRWVARAVDAPLLVELPRRPGAEAVPTGALADRLRMVMGTAGVRSIVLSGTGEPDELTPFAAELGRETGAPVRIAGAAPNGAANGREKAGPAGVVLVVPSSLTRAKLAEAVELPTRTYGPVVGVVTYRPTSGGRAR